MITAPYNFVPLNKKVVYPHWAKLISHDVPFENSLSGTIELEILANTPIFVKDGMSAKEAETHKKDNQNKPFLPNNLEGKYFIPGTSIKGMIANVLEIISFGEIKNRVDDKRYAFRDLQQPIDYVSHFQHGKIKCGWLKKDASNNYIIRDCGIPGRISHKEIDRVFGTNFVTYFSEMGAFNHNKDAEKAAKFKYDKAVGKHVHNYSFEIENENYHNWKLLNFKLNGEFKGKVIFTGQPGRRILKNGAWTGKFYEFVFLENDINTKLHIDKKVVDNFLFAYFDHDKNQWSEDWKYWRSKLEGGEEIPVFFSKEGDNVKHFGLSYLYKLPYHNSVLESIQRFQERNNEESFDFVSCLFGYSKKVNEKLTNLKGRIHVGHAFAKENTTTPFGMQKYVLGTPKASYYPNYIAQVAAANDGRTKGYQTFMHDNAVISGYKRYPVRKDIAKFNFEVKMDKVATLFTPLAEGAKFTCTINYHNLRQEELGALISAITFHNKKDHFHSLGMGKPFGFGRISIKVTNLNSYIDSLKAFEAYMNYSINNWETTDQIKELLVTSSLQDYQEGIDKTLKYQTLNEFVAAKRRNNMWTLLPYSKIINKNTLKFESLSSETERQTCFSFWNKEKEVYKELTADNVKEKYEAKLSKKRNEITQVFEDEKKKLTEKLTAKLKELEDIQKANAAASEEQERIVKKEKAKDEAEIKGPSFDKINARDKNAFESLKTEIEVWSKIYYKINNVKSLEIEFPNGFLKETFRADLKRVLLSIANEGHKSQKENLSKPFQNNPFFKKISGWVGTDLAKKWFDELKN
jgi:CRISPR-associated protein (TIGR03986 family)